MSTADDAWRDWQDETKQNLTHPDLWPMEQAAFMAGYRRALEDAQEQADEIEGAPLYIDADNTVIWVHTRPQIDKWLRDRAVGVGTKDGDSDDD